MIQNLRTKLPAAALIFLVAGHCFVKPPAPPSRPDFHVSTTGSDGNDGSLKHPWKTVSHAAASVKPGATVHVAPGEYRGNITTSASGNSSARIRFISERQWGAKILGGSGEAVWLNRGNYVDIVGFDVTGGTTIGIENLGSYDRILNNRVHDIRVPCSSGGGAGIDDGSEGAGDNTAIDGNLVYSIGGISGCKLEAGSTPPGIYLSSPNGTVTNNLVVNVAMGMQEWHDTTNETVVNNTFVCNKAVSKTYGIVVGAGDYPCNSGTSCKNSNSLTANNITYGCTYGIEEEASSGGSIGSGNQYLNNDNYNAAHPLTIIGGGASAGNLTSDPKFVSNTGDATGDYHLGAMSPAVDAATAQHAPALDFSGGRRPNGKRFDIGAYEAGSTPGTWPWQ